MIGKLKKANRNVKIVELLGDCAQTSLVPELHELSETTEYWWPKLRVTIIFCLFSFLDFSYLIILSYHLLKELKIYFYSIKLMEFPRWVSNHTKSVLTTATTPF